MKKLLLLLSTNILVASSMIPLSNTLNINALKKENILPNTANQESIAAAILISNNKHNNSGKVQTGTQDYKDEFSKAINEIKNNLKSKNAKVKKITNLTTKFKNVGVIGPVGLSEDTFLNLLNSENVEIISANVTMTLIENQLYTYQAEYTAIIDGIKVTKNINGYLPAQLFADFQILSPYSINFNLEIEQAKDKISLEKALQNFDFFDKRGIKGFLDVNDQKHIEQQIIKYLGINSLKSEKLSLKNHTSNSINLVAASDARNYEGIVKLTWDLKLLEMWGKEAANHLHPDLEKGLVGYFYLEKTTKLMKYFDVYGALTNSAREIHPDFPTPYHIFTFYSDSETLHFSMSGKTLTNKIPEIFDIFKWQNWIWVDIRGAEPHKIKIFDTTTNNWEGLKGRTLINIDKMGQVTKN